MSKIHFNLLITFFLLSSSSCAHATQPCDTVQTMSYLWSCPDGTQGYFSITTDGCRTLVKYEPCLAVVFGGYREWLLQTNDARPPESGSVVLNQILFDLHSDLKINSSKSSNSNADIKNILERNLQKIQKSKAITTLPENKNSTGGSITIRSLSNTEISSFKERRNDQKRDVKKDDK